ncbi:MAG: hypothetical protein JXR19_06630 [Bacteroidia bacterium]
MKIRIIYLAASLIVNCTCSFSQTSVGVSTDALLNNSNLFSFQYSPSTSSYNINKAVGLFIQRDFQRFSIVISYSRTQLSNSYSIFKNSPIMSRSESKDIDIPPLYWRSNRISVGAQFPLHRSERYSISAGISGSMYTGQLLNSNQPFPENSLQTSLLVSEVVINKQKGNIEYIIGQHSVRDKSWSVYPFAKVEYQINKKISLVVKSGINVGLHPMIVSILNY